MAPQPVESKVALIRGANKGIGVEITPQLVRRELRSSSARVMRDGAEKLPRVCDPKALADGALTATSLR